MSDEEYPKMVYPSGHSVDASAHGTGKIVHSKEEEDEAMKDAPKKEVAKPAAKPAAGEPGWTKS
jgi:hypothetical protein